MVAVVVHSVAMVTAVLAVLALVGAARQRRPRGGDKE